MKQAALKALPENIDYYPSRHQTTPSVSERLDPVVYGKLESGPLTQEQIDSYDKNGYLFFESLLSQDEVKALQHEVESLKQKRHEIEPEYIIEEPDSGEIRSFFHVHTYNPLLKALATHPKIAPIAEQILGSKVYLHQSRINLKPAFRGKEFYWHSDFETWHVEDGMPLMRALSCTISLTENTENNGPLMVIPGSHKQFVSCVGKTPDNHYKKSLRKQEYGVPDQAIIRQLADQHGIVSFKGKPGSVVLFDCNIQHASNSNVTPYPRNNVFYVYNSILNILREPYCGLAPRPEHIATRHNCETV